MTEEDKIKLVKEHVLSHIPRAVPIQKPEFYTSLNDLVRAEMRYMKTCISCGADIQPCCGH